MNDQIVYETDFYQWSLQQAKLLKEKDFHHIDLENIIEEIESLSRSDKRALRSHLANLLMHMLKMQYQPEGIGNSKSWEKSIFTARNSIKNLINESPSMKKLIDEFIPESYESATYGAMAETNLILESFPKKCPWSVQEIMGEK